LVVEVIGPVTVPVIGPLGVLVIGPVTVLVIGPLGVLVVVAVALVPPSPPGSTTAFPPHAQGASAARAKKEAAT